MGAEIRCTCTSGRRSADGKALLETNEIIFRSPELKLKIPFSAITGLDVVGADLRVTHGSERSTFAIGRAAAEKWAAKVRNPKSLLDKLGVKPEHRVVVLGVKDAAFREQLSASCPDVSTRVHPSADIVFYQSDSVAGLERLSKLQPTIKRDGAVWLITPKGKAGIKYDDMLAAAKAAGLVDVKISAWNDTHTATKLVIPKVLR